MKRWYTIDRNTLEVINIVDLEEKPNWVGCYEDQALFITLELPTEYPESDYSVVDTNGVITLEADAAKQSARSQSERNEKLAQLRAKRSEKLSEADVMINELVLGLRADTADVATYRQALLDFTSSYKDVNGDATSDIDALDLENISWPTAP